VSDVVIRVGVGSSGTYPQPGWADQDPEDELQPDESRHSLYAQVHLRFRAPYAALKPLFAKE